MSVHIPLEGLAAKAADYGSAAFVLVGAASGPPRVTHSTVRFDGDDLVVSVGRRAAAAFAANPTATVLWPGTDDQSMSLIVDGDVIGAVDANGAVRIRPTGAVRHRPAPA